MTVAELIAELQKYPPHAVVLKESFPGTFYMSIAQPCTRIMQVERSRVKGHEEMFIPVNPQLTQVSEVAVIIL